MTDILSPFLPGTNIQWAFDSTALGALKTCPRYYQYTMIEGWAAKHDNIHLRFGIEYHQALQDYDVSRVAGIDHDDSIHDVVHALLHRIEDWDPDPNMEKRSEKVKTKEALVRTVIWYLDKFENDPAKTFILQNGKPAVELSFKFELDWGPKAGIDEKTITIMTDSGDHEIGTGEVISAQPYTLCGHLDRIVDFGGSLFVMDRKTTTTTPGSYYFAQYEPNNQMSLYTLASQIVIDSPVKGVIIDVAQVAEGWSEFQRGFTYRTPDQSEEWLVDLARWLDLAERYAEEDYWPQNDTACGMYGGCRFRGVCSKSPQVRENFLRSEFVKGTPWNPLAVR